MSTIVATLESLLSPEQVVGRDQIAPFLSRGLQQATSDGSLPEAVVYPQTEAELGQVMACADQNHWRVLPIGGGSKLGWGGLGQTCDVAICTQRLNSIIDHAVGDMTLTAGAGLRLSDLKPRLAQHRQFLAVDPAYPDLATLGGIVSTASTGSLRQRYASVRDMLIGISFVRSDGQLAKAGGRVVKNVAGYDLMKLMTGAYGSLGIISQVTFRLYPIPDSSQTVVAMGSPDLLGRFTAALRQSSLTPVCLDVLSPTLAADLGLQQSFALVAQFQANRPGVEEQIDRFHRMAPDELSLQVLEGTAESELWSRQGERLFPSWDPKAHWDETLVVTKFGVLPDTVLDLLAQVHSEVSSCGRARIHVGSGIGTLALWAEAASLDYLQKFRQWCEAREGYCTLLQAPKAMKQSMDVWGYNGKALPLMGRIKTTFDPNQLLSPGRFLGGL